MIYNMGHGFHGYVKKSKGISTINHRILPQPYLNMILNNIIYKCDSSLTDPISPVMFPSAMQASAFPQVFPPPLRQASTAEFTPTAELLEIWVLSLW